MFPRWGRAVSHLSSTLAVHKRSVIPTEALFFDRSFAKAAAAAAALSPLNSRPPPPSKRVHDKPEIKLNTLFWFKPYSLALAHDSPVRVEEPRFEGIRRIIFKLLLFYGKQSKSIRGANVVYRHVISQVDKPTIYDVFQLEKTFKTTFSLLVLASYAAYFTSLEGRRKGGGPIRPVSINLLLIRWMKELKFFFYGNIVAYHVAMKLEARHDDLASAIWRNIFFEDDDSENANASAATAIHACSLSAMARYTRRESTSLSLTDKEAVFSGNFIFTSLGDQTPNCEKPAK